MIAQIPITRILDRTVREIAVGNPATVRIFESLGIDYCCGGRHPLREACERANVPTAHVLELLAALDSGALPCAGKNWADAPLAELADHIVIEHHGFVRRESTRLEALLGKVVTRHGRAHPELASIRDLFLALTTELTAHMFKEEMVLFPFIRKLEAAAATGSPVPRACFDSVGTPIARMMLDHDDAGESTTRIRALSADYQPPDGACPSYRGLYSGLDDFERDLHRHVHLENNILFPRAFEMERALRPALVHA